MVVWVKVQAPGHCEVSAADGGGHHLQPARRGDILKQAPLKYYRAFLYSETDENDLTYFLLHQSEVIRKASDKLHDYISRRTKELRASEKLLRDWRHLNHRQPALIGHALRHPKAAHTVEGHQRSHNTAYDTARKDLLALVENGLLDQHKSGKKMIFYASPSLDKSIREGIAGSSSGELF